MDADRDRIPQPLAESIRRLAKRARRLSTFWMCIAPLGLLGGAIGLSMRGAQTGEMPSMWEWGAMAVLVPLGAGSIVVYRSC